jgi:hypothetical protein
LQAIGHSNDPVNQRALVLDAYRLAPASVSVEAPQDVSA